MMTSSQIVMLSLISAELFLNLFQMQTMCFGSIANKTTFMLQEKHMNDIFQDSPS